MIDISSIPFTSVQWFNPWGCNNTNWSGANLHTNEVILSNNDSLLFVTAGQSELFAFDITNPLTVSKVGEFVNLNDTLATHGLDVWNDKIILSFIHTPFHIPPFTPFFADPGGLKLLDFSFSTLSTSISETSLNNGSLKIYPNPNEGQNLFISCNSPLLSIRMMNSIGQLVFVQLKNKPK
ncbi:MAG: hypothetical protein IPK61_17200 [Saprospiraceae bacterium]|nr:hypothetical protein [Saprospiraceae bacterium]